MGHWEVGRTHYQNKLDRESGLPPRKLGPAFASQGVRRSLKPELDRVVEPTVLDIVWAAGIYEGEGSCFSSQPRNVTVTVSQKDRWLLDRLRSLFGGTVHTEDRKSREGGAHEWKAHGIRAVDFLTEIYLYLSPRRQDQICKLYAWSSLLEAV